MEDEEKNEPEHRKKQDEGKIHSVGGEKKKWSIAIEEIAKIAWWTEHCGEIIRKMWIWNLDAHS